MAERIWSPQPSATYVWALPGAFWQIGYLVMLSLDHDLGPDRQRQGKTFDPGIGRDVAEFLVTRAPSCSVLIHSSNVEAAHGMQFTLEDAGWSVERVAPFDDLAWIKAQWSGLVVVIVEKAKKQ